ncbi:MAG: chemotaxis protein CheA [Gemmatimonadota bacterium]|nr:chemotaxis protein CheA [Gemmatimonadota bacterium]
MELSGYADLFLSESREHLAAINHLLLALEADPRAREPVEGVFRAVHTIKGMSPPMGYAAVAALAHVLENVLERVRRGDLAVGPELAELFFQGADALERAIESALADTDGAVADPLLLARLQTAAAAETWPRDAVPTVPVTVAADAGPAIGLGVEVVVRGDAALPAVRAMLVLRRARELGRVGAVAPPEPSLSGEDFAGTLRFVLESDQPADAVRAALVAVGDLERVVVAEPRASAPDAPAPEAPVGARPAATRSVRVDLSRMDALMNSVGELVIARDRLRQLAEGGSPELAEALEQAGRLIGELQHEVVQARLVPVAQIFDRFPRLVRDAARALGKRVALVVEGENTEFDRSVLDEMGDPLVHLLRNAVDHGIETPAQRAGAGKPEAGTLRLVASRERSRVAIRVEDDGAGIRRDRVAARAVAAGLIDADTAHAMADEEMFRLLLHPGFSTAEAVTDVSGRGVGLDVVATRVRAMGGVLEIESAPGRGTAFTLRLPLSLAIVRALLVRSGGESYALPLTHVAEVVELPTDAIRRVGGRAVVVLRDETVPLLDLAEQLGSAPASAPQTTVVVLELGGQPVGLRVDGVVGQREIVVKQFDATVCTLRCFSGASILADGRPALILDVGALVRGEAGAAAAVAF